MLCGFRLWAQGLRGGMGSLGQRLGMSRALLGLAVTVPLK